MQQNDLVRRALLRYQSGKGGAATMARLQAGGVSPGPAQAGGNELGMKRNILLGQALSRAQAGPVSARTQARIDRGLGTGKGVRVTGAGLANPTVRDASLAFLRKRTQPFQQASGKGALGGIYKQGY